MCDPVTLTIAATTIAAAGTGMSALQASSQAKYQSRVAARNVSLENERARDAIDRGKIENLQLGRKVAAMKGDQAVALAANGLDANFGSAAALGRDTAMFAGEDAAALYRNQSSEVRGIDISASNYEADRLAKKQASSNALVKGAFDFGSTVLGGATQYGKLKAGPLRY